jgi:hypothetical protein
VRPTSAQARQALLSSGRPLKTTTTGEAGTRKHIAVLAAAVVAAIATPLALADQPTFVPVSNTDFVDSTSCSFSVGVHIDASNETAKIFSNGDVIITGTLKVTLTNLSDPLKSLSLNASGPGFFLIGESGALVFKGAGSGFGPLGNPPTLMNVHGLVLIPLVPSGPTTIEGHAVDLCAALS